jgi:hypothetical protein
MLPSPTRVLWIQTCPFFRKHNKSKDRSRFLVCVFNFVCIYLKATRNCSQNDHAAWYSVHNIYWYLNCSSPQTMDNQHNIRVRLQCSRTGELRTIEVNYKNSPDNKQPGLLLLLYNIGVISTSYSFFDTEIFFWGNWTWKFKIERHQNMHNSDANFTWINNAMYSAGH